MNVFTKPTIANRYDDYYQTDFGKKIDEIEQNVVSDLIKDVPRGQMIELGCGTGHWSEYFAGQGFNVTGTDNSEAMLKLARKKNLNAGFLQADAQDLPFPNESFPAVSSVTMLEFVDNRDKVFQEIYRILEPEGWLILGCLNAGSVLGENKEQDEVFKNAQFMNTDELRNKLQLFGKPEFNFGVYLTPDLHISDNTNDKKNNEPAFIAAIVQKTR
jgi:ubiquinone/menaquinone biosynthesis C-methylase UbiE